MPLMTRFLTKEEYGLMSLVFVTLSWLGTIARLGFAQSTTRFYAEYKKKGSAPLQGFCSNILFGTILSGTVVVSGAILASYLLERNNSFSNFAYYLRIAAVIVLFRITVGVLQEIYRAEKSHFLYNLISIGERYGSLFCSIFLLYLYRNITSVFLGTIIAEGIVMVIFSIHLFLDKKIGLVGISREILSEANKYGIPLVLVGSSAVILDSGDRYVIQYFLNSEAVANYSVAYDASNFLGTFILTPIRLAIVPILFSLWVNQGEEATAAFTAKALRYIFSLIIPTIFGFSLLGREIITLMASSKYTESSELIPYVVSGILIGGINFILSSGLRTQKRTAILAWMTLASGALNVFLNFIFVPYYGIKSSAIITLVTYLLHTVVSYKISSKYLVIKVDFKAILKSICASVAMVSLILALGDFSQNVFVSLVVKVLIGIFSYTTMLLTIDRELRESLLSSLRDKKLSFISL